MCLSYVNPLENPPPPHPPIPQGSTQQKPWRPCWRFRQKSLIKILLNWNTNMTKCNTSKSEKNKEIKIYVIIFHWQFQRLRQPFFCFFYITKALVALQWKKIRVFPDLLSLQGNIDLQKISFVLKWRTFPIKSLLLLGPVKPSSSA